ncbi:MAG: MBL fold metallo-hydrolase [Bacteroidales bacterium]|nr:MBL fold metallo-hydrolase [Bacteroidales bacterium]
MGKLTLTFLGTGTSLGVPIPGCDCEVCSSKDPKDKRLRSSCLITFDKINPATGRNFQILIDAGPDFRYQMLRENVKYIDAILLTHEHRDHIAGLDDVRSYNYYQQGPMDIFGNKEALTGLKKMMYYAFDNASYPGIPMFALHLIGINPQRNFPNSEKDALKDAKDFLPLNRSFNIGGIDITLVEVMHAKLPTLAYRIGKVAYITDAKSIDEQEKQKLSGVKTLVVNALRTEEHFSHFNLEEALQLIDYVKPDVAYLTHISHFMGKYSDVEHKLPPNVHLSYDTLKIEVEY